MPAKLPSFRALLTSVTQALERLPLFFVFCLHNCVDVALAKVMLVNKKEEIGGLARAKGPQLSTRQGECGLSEELPAFPTCMIAAEGHRSPMERCLPSLFTISLNAMKTARGVELLVRAQMKTLDGRELSTDNRV